MDAIGFSYTIPADSAGDPGVEVNLLSNDWSQGNPYYSLYNAYGTYDTIDANGNIIHSDTITGLSNFDNAENSLSFQTSYMGGPISVFGHDGISFTIDNPADSDDGMGDVNVYDAFDFDFQAHIHENGLNHNEATSFSEVYCFAAGTLIDTPSGSVDIETLRAGDLIVTATGEHRSIRWIGHRRLDFRIDAGGAAGRPIRVLAGAFGSGRPRRDLLLSPAHAVGIDVDGGVLIPISALVNGATVVAADIERITYWHIELDSHDIILADGLPAETYLDTDDHAFFEDRPPRGLATTIKPQARCRPFVVDGPLLQAARDRLVVDAEALGWTRSGDMAIHLVVDGRRIEPERSGGAVFFSFPASASRAELVSETFVPAEVGLGGDGRRLGVSISGLAIGDGTANAVAVSLDDARLDGLFHPEEQGTGATWRWTKGRFPLPDAMWGACRSQVTLWVTCDDRGGARWVPPAMSAHKRRDRPWFKRFRCRLQDVAQMAWRRKTGHIDAGAVAA